MSSTQLPHVTFVNSASEQKMQHSNNKAQTISKHLTGCHCKTCIQYLNKAQSSTKITKSLSETNTSKYKKIRCWRADFYWLLEQLATLKELSLEPCLRIPETVLWKNGVPTCLLRYEGKKVHRFVTGKMCKRFVQLHFCASGKFAHSVISGIGHDFRPGSAQSISDVFSRLSSVSRKIPLLRNGGNNLKNDDYKAVLRLRRGGLLGEVTTKLLTEKAFVDVMTKWSTKDLKEIVAMQEYVKTYIGEPYVIRTHYSATLPSTNKDDHIDYSPGKTKEAQSDLEERMKQCKEICRNICYHLSTQAKIEILEMKAEFMTSSDEHWLYNAYNIIWRIKKDYTPPKEDPQAFYVMNQAFKNSLVQRLETKSRKAIKEKEIALEDMCGKMAEHVEEVKSSTGITHLLAPDVVDTKSNLAFEKLRPECPYRLTELLNPSFGLKKSFVR